MRMYSSKDKRDPIKKKTWDVREKNVAKPGRESCSRSVE